MDDDHEDIFQILLATDCHLGYLERDVVRGSDSFVTFEEILNIANEKQVDFILFGGDLFHENRPSRKALHDCMSLLRKYCMGDRPIQFEFLSDQSENFKHSAFPIVNFEDANLNISIPVFSIHGNHDDPAGTGSFCTLDLLSVTGLVNYFGKCTDLDDITISPLLLQKGKTKLCLYGMGSIRDERLHRLFLEGKVTMLRPREKTEEWFNLMVLHQNRAKHGFKNYIPEHFLDNFMNLIVWGHEHECRIKAEWNSQQSFYVTQPGSSVVTSLCPGEAVKKHVGLLQIKEKKFQITEIPLKTVRQFYFKDIDLEETSLDLNQPDSSEKVIEYCKELVDNLIEKAEEEHSGNPKQPKQPLIRLRIYHPESFDTFSIQRFGHSYVSKVANPKDIILFNRKKVEKVKSNVVDSEMLKAVLKHEGFDKSRVEDLVKKYFQQADEDKKLKVLSEVGVSLAIQEYVDKQVKEAINSLVTHQLNKTQKHLKNLSVEDSQIDESIIKYKEERQKNSQSESSEVSRIIREATSHKNKNDNVSDMDNDSLDDAPVEIQPSRGRGRGRGRGGRGRGRGQLKTNASNCIFPDAQSSVTSKISNNRPSSKRKADNVPTKQPNKQNDLNSYFRSNSRTYSDNSEDEDYIIKPSKKQRSNKANMIRGVVFDISD